MDSSGRIAIVQLVVVLYLSSSIKVWCAQNSTLGDKLVDCFISDKFVGRRINECKSDKVEIKFNQTEYILLEALLFENKSLVALNGNTGQSVHINCHRNFGITFTRVANVNITNIIFSNCNQFYAMKAAITIQFSDTVYIYNVTVQNSFGSSLYLLEVSQAITIDSTQFIQHHRLESISHVSKVLIEALSVDGPNYKFQNCTFTNSVEDTFDGNDIKTSQMGRGLSVIIRNITRNLNLEVTLCNFEFNVAQSGAGINLTIMDFIQNNSIIVKNSVFNSNFAKENGGGVSIQYIQLKENMTMNSIQFINCNFTNNMADHGGAIFLASSLDYGSCEPHNFISFEYCNLIDNQATLGSAVYLAPTSSNSFLLSGSFLKPFFSNCYFENNIVHSHPDIENNISIFGKGAIYSNELNINFSGIVTFSRNNGSALFLVSSTATFSQCNATFTSNEGYYGGSMAMLRNSAIHLNDHSYLTFDSNVAQLYGGALYHETYNDPSETGIYRCFIRYVGKGIYDKLVRVEFKNNSIKNENRASPHQQRGHSIFLYSLSPCRSPTNDKSVEDTLKDIANIYFKDYKVNEVSTLASHYTNVSDVPTAYIPGKETNLNIEVEDDTNTIVTQVTFHASLSGKSADIDLDPAYEFVSNGIIKFIGEPSSTATLSILINYRPDYQLSLVIKLEDCPPGYVLDNRKCECSANTADKVFAGIKKCNLSTFQAIIIQGYWAGYINSSSDSFRTSNCPFSFCNVSSKSEFQLPLSKSDLNLCRFRRYGRVCSLCINSSTLFYHTQGNAHCGDVNYCYLGALFYLLLEIIPVTVFFAIIILYDVNLTSGNLCSFLLYAQIFNTLEVTAGNFITFPPFADFLLMFLRFLLGIFNLDFFLLPQLSFCIFRNANYMQLLLFSYLTIFYAFILIVLTVFAINYRLKDLIVKRIGNKYFKNPSIIHGLSSFLVICFARTINISLQILNPVTLFGKGGQAKEIVVYYHGEYKYFGKDHQPFAALAIITLVMACLPVLLLLMYPTCYQLVAILKLEKWALYRKFCNFTFLEKFRPFLDSFQSTFRDNHRYFAGLFFLYRLAALAINNGSNTNSKFFFSLEVCLLIAVTIHGIIQPHKDRWHNQVDIAILALLAILNTITSFNYHLSLVEVDYTKTINVLASLQILLAYLPIVYIFTLLSMKLKMKLQGRCFGNKCCKMKKDTSEEVASNAIMELLDHSSVDMMSSYRGLSD